MCREHGRQRVLDVVVPKHGQLVRLEYTGLGFSLDAQRQHAAFQEGPGKPGR